MELRDGRKPTLGPPLTRRTPVGLLHLEHGRPAEVTALGTLRRLEVLEAVSVRDAGGAALETFDGDGIHIRSIGAAKALQFPSLGDRRTAAPR